MAEKIKYGTALYDAEMIRILSVSADCEFFSSVHEIYEGLDSSVIYPFWNPKTGNFENPSEPNVSASAETEPVGSAQKTPAKRTAVYDDKIDAQLSSTKSGKRIKKEK